MDNQNCKTIIDLERATAQEVFDLVTGHLLRQNAKSQNEDEWCLYRGPNGLKCAAGFLLKDDVDFRHIESNNWSEVIKILGITEHHEILIWHLQRIHDDYDCEDWKECLSQIAKSFDLNTKILEKVVDKELNPA